MKAWITVADMLPLLLTGAVTTIVIMAGSFVLAVLLGLLGGLLRGSGSALARFLAVTYVDIFRAVPVLTQLFIIYFGLVGIGVRLDPLPAAVLGFGINGGAYLTEVFRAELDSVHKGQVEAAQMLGLRQWQRLWIVELPQAMRVVLPPLGNFAVSLVKDTALASAVAAPELMFRAQTLVDKTFLSTQIYLTVAVIYLMICLPLGQATRRLEARVSRGRR